MKILLKLLKWGALALVSLIVLLLVGATTVWLRPSLVINPTGFTYLSHYLQRQGMKLHWDSLDLSAHSLSFWQKQLDLQATKFCLDSAEFHACFPTVVLQARVLFKKFTPEVEVVRLALPGGEVRSVAGIGPSQEDSASTEPGGLIPKPPDFLKYFSGDQVAVALHSLEVLTGDWRLLGSGSLILNRQGPGSGAQVHFQGTYKTGNDLYEGVSDVALQSLNSVWQGPYLLNGEAQAQLPGKQKLHVSVDAKPGENESVNYVVEGTFKERRKSVVATVRGNAGAHEITATVDAHLDRLTENFPSFALQGCRLHYVEESKKPKSRLELHCPAQLTGTFPRFKDGPREILTHQAKLVADADIHIEDLPDQPGTLNGTFGVTVDPISQSLKNGKGTVDTTLAGNLQDFPKNILFDAKADLAIEKFQDVVRLIENLPWAVPSPFNQLDGSIHFSATGKGSLGKWEGQIPVEVGTRLTSQGQKLDIDGAGTLSLKNGPAQPVTHLDLEVILQDIRLMLPNLSTKLPPKAFTDNRIKGSFDRVPAGQQEPSFTYSIRVATKEKSVRLVSNLAEKPVPIDLSFLITEKEGLRGALHVLSFPAELFRRKATIKHFDISLAPDPAKSEVNGEIQVLYTDYTIRILILGLLNQPEIRFLSEPPLPEDQVIATLLFGKPPEELDENETASVGGARAAVADSAVSLASMYLLASTPVESVGYDPTTRVFKAKVRLADGTSLNVGSDLRELNEVGVRKRLGAHWAIATYLQNPLNQAQRAVTAFLEWSTRY